MGARRDRAPLLRGDGRALPFRDGASGAVTALRVSADIPG
jgi:hypothetical protein